MGSLAALWVAFALEVYLHEPTWMLAVFVTVAVLYSVTVVRVLGLVKNAVAERDEYAGGGLDPEPQPRVGSIAREGVLCQDVRWRKLGRVQYGAIAFPLLALSLVSTLSTGVPSRVLFVLALFAPVILACEWRLPKMGFIIEPDCIVLVRALNRTRIRWDEIDSFRPIAAGGFIDYDNRRIGVKRARRGIVPRATLAIPTVWLSLSPKRFYGPPGLRWPGGETTDPLGFLNEELRVRHAYPSQLKPSPFG